MKKKWLALPAALLMACALIFGSACGTTPSGTTPPPEDEPPQQGPEEDDTIQYTKEYNIIKDGVFEGSTASGTATTASGALKMTNSILNLKESAILPIGDKAAWEVNITGKLLTSGTGAQLLVAQPFTNTGRVYIGVNSTSKMVYIGVRLNTTYVNYGWMFSSAAMFNANHSYTFSYEDGIFYLSLDDAERRTMSDINFNQGTPEWLDGDRKESEHLTTLMKTVLAQDYVEMTSIGVNEFACNGEISSITVKTTAVDGYQKLTAHPLKDTKIFYLGSSITYGEDPSARGTAFGDIINKITGNPYAKQAVSGTTLATQSGKSDSYVERLENFNFNDRPDFLVVQLSTNDFSTSRPLGTVTEGKTSGFDTTTVSGAIEHIISRAKEKCPTVKVMFYAGAIRSSWGYRGAYESYLNGDLKKICTKWGIGLLDLFHADYKSYNAYMNDDIHPKLEGYAAGWVPLFVKYFEENL